jgi:hypothetical protein
MSTPASATVDPNAFSTPSAWIIGITQAFKAPPPRAWFGGPVSAGPRAGPKSPAGC